MIARREPRYRFNRQGEVVEDNRRMSMAYTNPSPATDGQRLFEPRRSSPARLRFRAQSSTNTEEN